MMDRAAGMLTAAPLESVKTLLALQDRENPAAVRLGAARAVLELGYVCGNRPNCTNA
jgi:hypothetical protein